MTDRRKLIEMDEKKSHGAKTEGWNIMLKKKGGASKELDHVCFCDNASLPTLHCAQLCKRWVKKLHIWNAIGTSCDWFSLGWGGGTELT